MEGNRRTCIFSLTYNLNFGNRLSFGVLLDENLTLPMDLSHEKIGKRIYAGNTDSVESSGNLIT